MLAAIYNLQFTIRHILVVLSHEPRSELLEADCLAMKRDLCSLGPHIQET